MFWGMIYYNLGIGDNDRYKKEIDMLIKGNFVYAVSKNSLIIKENKYMHVEDGVVQEFYDDIPESMYNEEVRDYKDSIIIPAFNDLHVHASQYLNRGVGFDKELIPWLNTYTFPLEAGFAEIDFAKKAYEAFTDSVKRSGTMRFVAFATLHEQATWELMRIVEKSGLKAYIGKVNMDRNSSEKLTEETGKSLDETERLINRVSEELKNVKYILTPRFVPSTTERLMTGIAKLAETYNLPVQSHLSENVSEVEWVKKLHPAVESYTKVYEEYGLLRYNKTIMAHAIYLDDKERELLNDKNVYLAHCAQSNANLTSGIMPLRKYMNEGLNCVIASDVAAGNSVAMNRHIEYTIQMSKINELNNKEDKAVNITEALYMATKAPGRFFGKVGSFEKGYEFDALVIDMGESDIFYKRTPFEKLEQFIYTGDDRNIKEKYCSGKIVE